MTGIRNRLLGAGFRADEAGRRADLFAVVERAVDAVGSTGWRFDHVPGRIEVFGKHTDYAGGRSLVCATEQGVAMAVASRADSVLAIVDAIRGERREFPIGPDLAPPRGDWANYPMTVASRLARDFGPIGGVDLVFASDLPIAGGVSSSSALVVAVARALIARNELAGTERYRRQIASAEDLAGYLGAVENGRPFRGFPGGGGVGTMGGSQDHTAILCSKPDALTQFRFDPVRLEASVPWPDQLEFVIAASGVPAEKTGAALAQYNGLASLTARLRELMILPGDTTTTLGRAIIDPADLGDIQLAMALRLAGLPDQAEAARLRARMVQLVAECRTIIPVATAALARGDLGVFGQMALSSQRGAELGLGNQVPETIDLVLSARALGAVAASAFGAGFGGSVWAIVRSSRARVFTEAWEAGYRSRFPERSGFRTFRTRPAIPATWLA